MTAAAGRGAVGRGRCAWCIATGWALDLLRGEQSRPHGNLEIAVPAARFPEIRDHLPKYVWGAVGAGRVRAGEGEQGAGPAGIVPEGSVGSLMCVMSGWF
ncbi:nucleotidyltransferase domain-containing protein [Streptomyces sp. NPDC057694]|uniref:nucleotidyltransferase domain-containing protein n=1 Tax=Streptomyces sp. NPDC057694 TaxID=3346216 RepID=UPI0036CCCFF8